MTFVFSAMAIAFVCAFVWWRQSQDKRAGRFQPRDINPAELFKRRPTLLTPNEHDFFLTLKSAVPDLHVHGQVSMLALVEPRYEANVTAFRRIANRRLDYVITDAAGEVVCVVELDDFTHIGREAEDAERDAILNACGYFVLRYESRAKPTAFKAGEDVRSIRA